MSDQPPTPQEPAPTPPQAQDPGAETSAPAAVPVDVRPQAVTAPSGPGSLPFTWGTGRRKTAVARVRIFPGDGKFLVNKREVSAYFPEEKDRLLVRAPLEVAGITGKLDVLVRVDGGGISGQAGAIALGLGRALKKSDPSFEQRLRQAGFLTRDPRMVERKKYGQRGARRRFQFSKR